MTAKILEKACAILLNYKYTVHANEGFLDKNKSFIMAFLLPDDEGKEERQ